MASANSLLGGVRVCMKRDSIGPHSARGFEGLLMGDFFKVWIGSRCWLFIKISSYVFNELYN